MNKNHKPCGDLTNTKSTGARDLGAGLFLERLLAVKTSPELVFKSDCIEDRR
jgi:hypothetical protein